MIDQINYSEEWSIVDEDDRVWVDLDNHVATLEHDTGSFQVTVLNSNDQYSAYLFIQGLNGSVALLSAKVSENKDAIGQTVENSLPTLEALAKITKLL